MSRLPAPFADLPDKIVIDSNYETSLSEEHLLDKDGSLTLIKKWSGPKAQAKEYVRCWHPISISEVEEDSLLTWKIAALKKRFKELGCNLEEIDGRIAAHYRRTIWESSLKNNRMSMGIYDVDLSGGEGTKPILKKIHDALPENYHPLSGRNRVSQESEGLAQDPAKAVVADV